MDKIQGAATTVNQQKGSNIQVPGMSSQPQAPATTPATQTTQQPPSQSGNFGDL